MLQNICWDFHLYANVPLAIVNDHVRLIANQLFVGVGRRANNLTCRVVFCVPYDGQQQVLCWRWLLFTQSSINELLMWCKSSSSRKILIGFRWNIFRKVNVVAIPYLDWGANSIDKSSNKLIRVGGFWM